MFSERIDRRNAGGALGETDACGVLSGNGDVARRSRASCPFVRGYFSVLPVSINV